MLDALMGPSRNVTVGTDSDVPDFADDKVFSESLTKFSSYFGPRGSVFCQKVRASWKFGSGVQELPGGLLPSRLVHRQQAPRAGLQQDPLRAPPGEVRRL